MHALLFLEKERRQYLGTISTTNSSILCLSSGDVLGEEVLFRRRPYDESELAVRFGDALDELVGLRDLLEVRGVGSDDPPARPRQRSFERK